MVSLKSTLNTGLLMVLIITGASAQGISLPEGNTEMIKDSMPKMEVPKYKNTVSAGAKVLFSPLSNTITTFSAQGFSLDREAIEYQLKLYNLPKLFYYQQLGTLTAQGSYASITGIGMKEDVRFDIIKSKYFVLAPYIELGGGYFRANLVRDVTSNSISTVLGAQVQQSSMDNFVVSGDVGLDLGFAFPVDNNRVAIVFNGGYISNFPSPWRLAGSLAFKEKINLSSPYAGVTVRIERMKKECCKGCCTPMKN